MQVHAIVKNVRVSPFKARLVVEKIKRMQPSHAVKVLDFVPRKAAKPIKKVVMSAIANARNNNGLDENSLKFKEIQVGHGIIFKRYRPVSRGRAHHILKRTSTIRVVLEGDTSKELAKATNEKDSQDTKDIKEIKENKHSKDIKKGSK